MEGRERGKGRMEEEGRGRKGEGRGPFSLLANEAFFLESASASVTLVDCIQTAEDIVKLLSRPVSPHLSSSLSPSISTQFQGESLQQGHKIHRGEKILRFSTEITVYLGNGTR